MLDLERFRLRSIPIRYSLLVFVIAAITLLAIISVEVTIIVESPGIGDISDIVGMFVGGVVTVVGLVSGIITIYNFVSDPDGGRNGGPADRIVIEGNFHYHIGDPTFRQTPSAEQTNKKETDDSPERESKDGESATKG